MSLQSTLKEKTVSPISTAKDNNDTIHVIVDYWVGPSMLITLLPLLLWCCGGKFSIYATHWMIVPQNTEIYITLENSGNISNGSLSRIASTISKTVKIYPRTRRKLTYIFCSASRRRFCKFWQRGISFLYQEFHCDRYFTKHRVFQDHFCETPVSSRSDSTLSMDA